jgi:serine protease Do
MKVRSFRKGLIAGIFLSLGVVIGLILASNLGWFVFGTGGQTVGPIPAESSTEPGVGLAGLPPEQTFVEVAKHTMPAVVNISTTRLIRGREGFPETPFFDDPFFRRFFGDEFFRQFEAPRQRREQSLGSGVIVDPNGLIITNNHVISKADEIKVLLNDKREFKGKVIGTDPKTDIAVIQINAKDLPTIPWGDSDRLQVGEYVLAIGNPFGLNQTVTMGIISAVGRAQVGIADYEDFIQTDAAINPGNSGGALINTRGELIGINTAIFSQSGGYMGIGFAVPSNMSRAVMDSLVKTGKVVRGWLGISIQDLSEDLAKEFGVEEVKGALVGEVQEGSPADKAGIKPGDVIVGFNGKSIEGSSTLRNMVAQTPVGKKVKIKLIRDKKSKELDVTLGELPKEMAEASIGAEGDTEGSAALAGLEVMDLSAEVARRLNLSESLQGVVIVGVEPDSPADETGLRRGDVIQEINHKPMKNLKEFRKAASEVQEDDSVLMLINRQGRKIFFVVKP